MITKMSYVRHRDLVMTTIRYSEYERERVVCVCVCVCVRVCTGKSKIIGSKVSVKPHVKSSASVSLHLPGTAWTQGGVTEHFPEKEAKNF